MRNQRGRWEDDNVEQNCEEREEEGNSLYMYSYGVDGGPTMTTVRDRDATM